MVHAKGRGFLGRSRFLSCVERSSPVLDEDEPLGANKRCQKASCCGDMDTQIWRNFPEALIELVLARLPIVTLVRFRSVCKEWNSMMSTSERLQRSLRQAQSQQQPWFYTLNRVVHNGVYLVSMYDPCSNKWYHSNLPRLPATPPGKDPIALVGSAGGLICFADRAHGRFYVCNPITRSVRELPRPFQHESSNKVGMYGSDTDYNIFSLNPNNGALSLYKSRDNSWTSRQIDSIAWMFWPGYNPSFIYRHGTINLMFISHSKRLVSYDLATRACSYYRLAFPSDVVSHKITESRGKIVLLGLVKIGEVARGIQLKCCIWELMQEITTGALSWKEVSRMPGVIRHTSPYMKVCDEATCYGSKGDSIMVTFNFAPRRPRHVVYNFETREWLSVRSSGHPPPHKELGGTAFQPCLFALP